MPLRFPNPGSDIARLVNSFRLIHRVAEAEERRFFDLDFMTRVMTENFQASSRGTIGAAAQKRSANADRSRDPLFNQSKMYSEVYRTLGWLRIGERRQALSTTFLGDAVADLADFPDVVNGLVRQSLLALTFPNPATDNVGVVRHRPFRWLLLLTAELGGEITRDEMILGLLRVTDDRAPGALDEAVTRIQEVRGGDRSVLDSAVAKYAAAEALQVNTLSNYTRLPVGVLKSAHLAWGESARLTNLYRKPINGIRLTAPGLADAEWVRGAVDVREADLEGFPRETRAQFANFAFYSMLLRAGVGESQFADELEDSARGSHEVLEVLGIEGPSHFIYSPVLEASDEILGLARGGQ